MKYMVKVILALIILVASCIFASCGEPATETVIDATKPLIEVRYCPVCGHDTVMEYHECGADFAQWYNCLVCGAELEYKRIHHLSLHNLYKSTDYLLVSPSGLIIASGELADLEDKVREMIEAYSTNITFGSGEWGVLEDDFRWEGW